MTKRYGVPQIKIIFSALVIALTMLSAAQAVTLRYGGKVGDTLKYRNTSHMEGSLTMQGPMGEMPIPIIMDMVEKRAFKVAGPGDDNTMWIESSSLGIKGAVSVAGQANDLGDKAPKLNYKFRINDRGQTFDMQKLKKDDDQQNAAVNGLEVQLGQMNQLGQLVTLPEGDIEVGATWESETTMTAADGTTIKGKVKNTLASVEKGIATIVSQYQMPIPPSTLTQEAMGQQMEIQVEGTIAGTSTTYWNVEAKQLVKTDSKTQVSAKISVAGMEQPLTITMAGTSKNELVTGDDEEEDAAKDEKKADGGDAKAEEKKRSNP